MSILGKIDRTQLKRELFKAYIAAHEEYIAKAKPEFEAFKETRPSSDQSEKEKNRWADEFDLFSRMIHQAEKIVSTSALDEKLACEMQDKIIQPYSIYELREVNGSQRSQSLRYLIPFSEHSAIKKITWNKFTFFLSTTTSLEFKKSRNFKLKTEERDREYEAHMGVSIKTGGRDPARELSIVTIYA